MGKKLKLNSGASHKVRLSFPDLFEASDFQGDGNFKYRATFHVEANDPQKAAIDAAIKEVARETWKEKADAVLANIEGNANKMCFIDGNRKEVPGKFVLSTSRRKGDGAPAVVDRDHSPAVPHYLTSGDGRPYSGCYVNATVEFWAWDNKNGKGISCTLIGVQFHSDGDAFSATPAASADDFGDLTAGADASELV